MTERQQNIFICVFMGFFMLVLFAVIPNGKASTYYTYDTNETAVPSASEIYKDSALWNSGNMAFAVVSTANGKKVRLTLSNVTSTATYDAIGKYDAHGESVYQVFHDARIAQILNRVNNGFPNISGQNWRNVSNTSTRFTNISGEIKRRHDYNDSKVSTTNSFLSTHASAFNSWTGYRKTQFNRLDATVSSRAVAADVNTRFTNNSTASNNRWNVMNAWTSAHSVQLAKLDATISSRASAADMATRFGNNSSAANYRASVTNGKVDAVKSDTASIISTLSTVLTDIGNVAGDVWTYVTRTLTGIGTSGIASEANATANTAAIIASETDPDVGSDIEIHVGNALTTYGAAKTVDETAAHDAQNTRANLAYGNLSGIGNRIFNAVTTVRHRTPRYR